MEVTVVLVLLGAALVNFTWEWVPVEVFGLVTIVVLVVAGALSPEQAFVSFSSPAILMIAGIMILSGAVIEHGAADRIAARIDRVAGTNEPRAAALLLGSVNAVSAFINNVAATAMFIPVAEGIARRYRVSRSKYLMAVAFASMTGGMCTLVGTSTNIAVAGAMPHFGLEPLGLFELTPVGLAMAVIGMAYLLVLAPRMIPVRKTDDALETFGLRGFLFEILVGQESPLAGKTLLETDLAREFAVTVLAIVRGDERLVSPDGAVAIHEGDLLLVEGAAGTIRALAERPGLKVKSMAAPLSHGGGDEAVRMLEATVSYNSPFLGQSLKEIDFRRRFHLSVLAIHRHEEALVDKVGKVPLRAGDVLLVYGRESMLASLAAVPNVVVLESPTPRPHDVRKAALSAGIFAVALLISAAGWLNTPTAFLAGAAVVLLTGCLSPRQAAAHVHWRFLVMLAGMVALGLAMETTGAARLIAGAVVDLVAGRGPLVLMAAFFSLTVFLTQPLSNAAAALLVLPIAVHAAREVGADPRSFAVGVALAASCSFMTPFEPACLLVYGTGHYRFRDFLKVGAGLTLIASIVAMLLLPRLWPIVPPR